MSAIPFVKTVRIDLNEGQGERYFLGLYPQLDVNAKTLIQFLTEDYSRSHYVSLCMIRDVEQ